MKSYYDLIKEKIIDFEKVLLDQYYELGLSELECMVLLRLYQYSNHTSNYLNVNEIVKKMTVTSDEFSELVVRLVSKDFVSLLLDNNNGTKFFEVFSLEGAYRQLGYIFENKENKISDSAAALKMKATVHILEEKLKRILTPFEVSTVKKWFYDYKYDEEIINAEIEKNLKTRRPSINIIDRALFSRSKEEVDGVKVDDVKDIFNKMYGKKSG